MLEEKQHSVFILNTINELQFSDLQRLCIKTLEANIEVSVVQQIIKKLNLTPDDSAIALENWPWQVRIYTLGNFIVEIDNKVLEFTGKAVNKPLQLLKALIASDKQNIHKELLSEILWPDADGDAAQQALATTLHRLRKIIGHDAIIQKQGLISLSQKHCWSDIRSLEYFLSLASNELTKSHLLESWEHTQKVLRLYKGAFLENESVSHWGLIKRERVRRKLLHQIKSICSALCKNKLYDQAIEGYLKGLDIDDLQESFYQGLISCHLNLGQQSEAKLVYKQCYRLFNSILKMEPSEETQSLFKLQRQKFS